MGKRILAIIPAPQCFGLQNVTLAFFEKIAKRVPCHFLISPWNDGEFPDRLRKANIPYSEAWMGMFSRSLSWTQLKMTIISVAKLPGVYLALVRLYRRFRPTCILLANYHEAILLWPVLIFVRRIVVCHMHDPPPPIPFQRTSFWFWRKAVGRFIFISESAKSRMAELGPLSDKDAVVLNGVDIRPLPNPRKRGNLFCERFSWPDASLIIGMTGQMSAHKGHEDFVAAAARLTKINQNVRFVIGGKKTGEFFEHLQAMVIAKRLGSVIGFSGWLNTSAEFFENIDLFVLPSRHDEGFGLVLAEAAERGLASVATRSGGAPEIIVDGQTGILVPKSRPDEMAAAIAGLLAPQSRRKEMGLAARARVSENFDLDRQALKIQKVLTETE